MRWLIQPGIRFSKWQWFAASEALSVFCMVLLYIWALRYYFPAAWVIILALITISHICRDERAAEVGFRLTNLFQNLVEYAPVLLLVSLVLLAVGFLFRSIRAVTLESGFASLALYFFWGLLQQYLLNGYFVNRFLEFSRSEWRSRVALLAAALFSAAHMPNWFLMLVTGVGGYLSARVYLIHKNLYFLGIAHGLIGFLLYLVVPDSISHHLYVGPKWFYWRRGR